MDESRPSRNAKKRDTYSPSRYDTAPLQRQPRKSANAVKKRDESSASPAPLSLPPSPAAVNKTVLPSASKTPSGNNTAKPSTSVSSGGNSSRKSTPGSLQPSSSKGPRKSLLKLPPLPPKEEIFAAKEPTPPVKAEPIETAPPEEPVFAVPTPPTPKIPFDYSEAALSTLPGRRNKSKSVYQMGLLPRTVPVIRPSARDRSKGSQPPSTDEETTLSPVATSVEVKEELPSDIDEALNSMLSPSPASTPSTSKTGAKRGRKPNPNALIPASSTKGARLSLSKFSLPVPAAESKSPTPEEPQKLASPVSKESSELSPMLSKESTKPSSSKDSLKLSPKESTKLSPVLLEESSSPVTLAPVAVKEEAIEMKSEPSFIPSAAADVPLPPPQEPVFVVPPLPPPKPIPFDYSNPTANELPDRRNKSKSVFEIAPLLAKKGAPRRPRKPSIKKISVSEAGNSDTPMPENANIEIGEDGTSRILNTEADNLEPGPSNRVAAATNKEKKKRKRKRPLRLTMKKKKVSKALMPVEFYEDGTEEGNDESEMLEGDDEASDDEVIIECELEKYGESSTQYLRNLHADIQASFKHYEENDGSFFTRFVLYGNAAKEDAKTEVGAADTTEYPSYLAVFLNGASGIIDLAENSLKQSGAVDVFATDKMSIQLALHILKTKFNNEDLCSVFVYGLTEIHKVFVQATTQKLPGPQFYVQCRDIANLLADSFIAYPTELLFIFHQLFLTHLDLDALMVYMILCRFVNQVFKISNVFKQFSAQYLDEINNFFVDTIKQNVVDPFREMVYKIDREFLSKDVVVVALVCNDTTNDQYLDFQKLMLWFNTGFRKMGAIVESLTLSADWNNPELLQISAYSAIAMVQSYFKFIIKTYPTSKLIVVNYGDPSMFFYHAIHYVERISGVINIAFCTSSVIDEVEHVRGGVEDTILNMAYCPSLFVTGEKAENSDISHYEQILKHYKSEQAGLIIVGDADDALTVSSKTLLQYGITPACVKRILLEHFADFIEKCIAQPLQPRTYFPSQNHENDPDFNLYKVTKEEVTAMHLKLFEQTKNYYDIRADLSRKLSKDKSDGRVVANGLTKEEVEAEIQSTKNEETMEKFSQDLVKLKFS